MKGSAERYTRNAASIRFSSKQLFHRILKKTKPMIKSTFQLATIGVMAIALSTSSALAKGHKEKGHHKDHEKDGDRKEHHDNGHHYGRDHRDRRDYSDHSRRHSSGRNHVVYYNDGRGRDSRSSRSYRETTVHYDYLNPGDYSYRTRYPREVVEYDNQSYGYNYYDLQSVLLHEGYYDGPLDGVWGPRSRGALVRYQTHRGWRGDGRVDGRLITTFNIGY